MTIIISSEQIFACICKFKLQDDQIIGLRMIKHKELQLIWYLINVNLIKID